MAVNAAPLPSFHPVTGVRLGTAQAGIKKPHHDDLVVMELAEGASVGAVFTRNAFRAAPVLVAEMHLAQGAPRYLLINTGNANAGTGEQGMQDALRSCASLGGKTGVPAEAVLPFSTGVIGEPLPVDRIEAALPAALQDLDPNGWARAASGIMTTDTLPKGATRRIEIDGKTVTLSGISKGAGMIRPNMATMLAFVATDASVSPALMQSLVAQAAEQSFNRITIDGDTSTNDACAGIATGASEAPELLAGSVALSEFEAALNGLFLELAHAIVRDAEGATKFVAVNVTGAASSGDALSVAYAVAESPLVKTALYASDPNWGRILAAVGRAGVAGLDVSCVSIHLGDVCIVRDGGRAAQYSESMGQSVMDRQEIPITIDLAMGQAAETVWTSDFSHEYVTINAEYRT